MILTFVPQRAPIGPQHFAIVGERRLNNGHGLAHRFVCVLLRLWWDVVSHCVHVLLPHLAKPVVSGVQMDASTPYQMAPTYRSGGCSVCSGR